MGNACCCDRKDSPVEENSIKSQRPAASLKDVEKIRKTPKLQAGNSKERTLKTIRKLEGSFYDYYHISESLRSIPHSSLSQVVEVGTNLKFFIREIPQTLGKTFRKAPNSLPAEAIIWKKLDHPNILRLLDVVQDRKSIYLISEHCPGEDFHLYLNSHPPLSDPEAASVMTQIFGVIGAGHTQEVLYRNMRPESFLFAPRTANTELAVKLVDVKDACLGSQKQQWFKYSDSPDFVAPEIRAKTPYTQKCDLWSAGVIMLKLLSGHTATNHWEALSDIEDRKAVNSEALDLMRRLLDTNPGNRPSVGECLAHSWLSRKKPDSTLFTCLAEAVANARQKGVSDELRLAVLRFLCTRVLSPSELSQTKSTFQGLDTNGDGRLSKSELRKASAQSSIPLPEAEILLRLFDLDGNGTIEFTEFLLMASNTSQLLTNSNLHLAFRSIDKDQNGRISIPELKQLLRIEGASDEVWEQYMSAVDKSQDGEIDFQEFKAWMRQACP